MSFILLAGLPSAGKTAVAELLRDMFDLNYINAGDALKDELENKGVKYYTRAEIGPVFLQNYSPETVYPIVLNKALGKGANVIDGIRLLVTCKQFLDGYKGTSIWFVEAASRIRRARLVDRLKNQGSSSEEKKKQIQSYSEYTAEARKIKRIAHIVIENNSSLHDLRQAIVKSYRV